MLIFNLLKASYQLNLCTYFQYIFIAYIRDELIEW